MDYNSYYINQTRPKPSINYNEYYKNQIGGTVFRGKLLQHGYGWGDSFRNFFRKIIPTVKEYFLPHLKKAGKAVGSELINVSTNLARDVLDGKNASTSAKTHMATSMDNMADNVKKYLTGQGIKRNANSDKFKKNIHNKKFKIIRDKDIFDYGKKKN